MVKTPDGKPLIERARRIHIAFLPPGDTNKVACGAYATTESNRTQDRAKVTCRSCKRIIAKWEKLGL